MFPTGIGEAIPELTIVLLPKYGGRGIGGKLLNHTLSSAKSRFPAVSLSVSESNPARWLYERAGFVPMGEAKGGSMTGFNDNDPTVHYRSLS
jgi:ribosomal protein S18 acetylase RimI-like enzyme